MLSAIVKTYQFLLRNKLVFIVFLFLVFSAGAFSLYNLKLEDNILNVLPKDSALSKFEQIANESNNTNKLIFILQSKEKSNIQHLIQAANHLHNYIDSTKNESLIHSIAIVQDESAFVDMLNYIYENIPLFLDSNDVKSINLDSTSLYNIFDKRARMLFTPAGAMSKNSIVNDPFDFSSIALKKLQSLQIDNNFFIEQQCIISNDSTYLLGTIELSDEIVKADNKKLLYNYIVDLLNVANSESNMVEHHVFGMHLIAEANAQRIKKDIMLSINLAMTLLLIFLMFYFRTVKVLLGFVIPILLGFSVAGMVLFATNNVVSAVSIGMGSVLLGTIIDYALHFFTHLKTYKSGESAIKHVSMPILAGSITTSLAFLTLFFVKSKALTDLAIFASVSMLSGAIFTIFILPVFFEKAFKNHKIQFTFIDRLGAIPFHKNSKLTLFIFLVFLTSIFFAKKVSFESDLTNLNYMPPIFAEAEYHLNKSSNVLQSNLVVLIEGNSLNEALLQTELIENKLLEKFDAKCEIKTAGSLIQSNELRKKRIENWNYFWNSNQQNTLENIVNEVSEKYSINSNAFAPFFNQLNHYEYNESEQFSSSMLENYINKANNDKFYCKLIVKAAGNDKEEITVFISNLNATGIYVLDRSAAISNMVDQVKTSLSKISWLLLLIILMVLWVYFRQIEMVAISFLPVAMSWITTFGLMGILGIKFNLINILVVVFVFGLGIDFSIYILSALRNDYQNKEKSIDTVKTSVILSAFTSFVGIGVLLFAKHPALQSIALAGILAIVSVFVYAIVFVPFIFNLVVTNRVEKQFEPITFKSIYDTFLAYFSLISGAFSLSIISILLRGVFFIDVEKRKLFFHYCLQNWARLYKRILFPLSRQTYSNEPNEDFKKPSLIISNHQSLIDTVIILTLYPKIIVLTKNWVRKNPMFAIPTQFADFYSVESETPERLLELLKQKTQQGFSIAVFPEGTRSENKKLVKFHRGAVHMASELQLDILPIAINGTIDTLHKNQLFGQRRNFDLSFFQRIEYDANCDKISLFKKMRSFYKQQYYKRRKEIETGVYYSKIVMSNFLYKDYQYYLQAKKTLKGFQNFESINHYFHSNQSLLIIDNNEGVLILMQSLINPEKQFDFISSNPNLVNNHYQLSSQANLIDSLLGFEKYELIFCMANSDEEIESILQHKNHDNEVVVLNTHNFKMSIINKKHN